MEKFLFNINSTSWFHTLKSGKVVIIEVFLLLMCGATYLGATGVSYEHKHGIEFGSFSLVMVMSFVILAFQYVLYANLAKPASLEIRDAFWKTQLWRFLDPKFAFQRSLYPNWIFKLEELKQKWFLHYGETPEDTLKNAPSFLKYRGALLLIAGLLGVVTGQLF